MILESPQLIIASQLNNQQEQPLVYYSSLHLYINKKSNLHSASPLSSRSYVTLKSSFFLTPPTPEADVISSKAWQQIHSPASFNSNVHTNKKLPFYRKRLLESKNKQALTKSNSATQTEAAYMTADSRNRSLILSPKIATSKPTNSSIIIDFAIKKSDAATQIPSPTLKPATFLSRSNFLVSQNMQHISIGSMSDSASALVTKSCNQCSTMTHNQHHYYHQNRSCATNNLVCSHGMPLNYFPLACDIYASIVSCEMIKCPYRCPFLNIS